ncbi:MAG: hypothetical protein Q8P86_00180 [bacterium]|nr:hypothetical protein [bacterium]
MFDYKKLKEVDIGTLNRQELGVDLNFNAIIPNLERIKSYLLFFEGRENSLDKDIEKPSIVDIFNKLTELINLVKTFSVDPNESHEQTRAKRTNILKKIRALHSLSNEKLLPLITHLKFNDTKIQETILSTQNKLTQIDNQFTSKLENFDNKVKQKISEFDANIAKANGAVREANRIKQEAENFTVDKLVAKYGEIFSDQATKNKITAFISLFIFILSLLALLFFTNWLFDHLLELIAENGFETKYVVVNTIFRLTLIGLASIIVKESLKSFNINMNLYNLNLHRQNSLQSFEILIANTRNSETRDFIIREIAKTIYSNQESGYLQKDKKINISDMGELIKSVK